ncbi:MAG: HEAT repeat domain-containing protein, partial [Chthoniobacteraceae bacterium]
DGRIYFTIADCGSHVTTKEGKVIDMLDSGAVFRCWPNGDALELYAWGLRNPQSLAFNDVGDLFTGDNNADGGDKARWIHLVEGADYGWRIGWQFLPKLGAWNSEGMWHLDVAQTNAAILPPVAHITHGPAGISHYPGTGLPEKYRDNFFVADFPGGVRHFALKQKGASYEVAGMAGDDPLLQNNSPSEMRGKLLWNLYPSDVQFPPGGGVCVLDWVYGWEKTGKGRIYRVHDPVTDASAAVQETKRLLAEDFTKRTPEELGKLLGHADSRVRGAATFAFRDESDENVNLLAKLARDSANPLQRIHAVRSIGNLIHVNQGTSETAAELIKLFKSPDAEVRAQAANIVGDYAPFLAIHRKELLPLLSDKSARVRFFAMKTLGKFARHDEEARRDVTRHVLDALMHTPQGGQESDTYIRFAAVKALADAGVVVDAAAQSSSSSDLNRLVSVLALRRMGNHEVAEFLADKNPRIRLEAVRAIHDAPIPAAMPALAAMPARSGDIPVAVPPKREAPKQSGAPSAGDGKIGEVLRAVKDGDRNVAAPWDAASRRVINADYRLGTAECAARLVAIAANLALAEDVRLDACEALAQWPVKLGRDRVLGIVVEGDGERKAADAAEALAPRMSALLGDKSDAIRIATLNAAGANKLTEAGDMITMLETNSDASGEVRAAALRALAEVGSPKLTTVISLALESHDKTLAEAARKLAGKISPEQAVKANAAILGKGSVREQQEALANIAAAPGREADRIITQQLDLLLAGKLKTGMILDLLEAAAARDDADIKKKLAAFESARKADDPLSRWRECLEGGDGKIGKQIFREKAEAACMRCHKVKGEGGDVGPDLAEVGKKMGREYVLRSIVDPNAVIAKGYDNVMVTMKHGEIVAGLLSTETADDIALKNPADGKLQRVKKSDVKERASLPSAMPPGMGEILGKRALRDVVQYLSTLK